MAATVLPVKRVNPVPRVTKEKRGILEFGACQGRRVFRVKRDYKEERDQQLPMGGEELRASKVKLVAKVKLAGKEKPVFRERLVQTVLQDRVGRTVRKALKEKLVMLDRMELQERRVKGGISAS